jgi:hypothetical protein
VRSRIAVFGLLLKRVLIVCVAMTAMVGVFPVRAETADSLGNYSIDKGPADKALLEYARQSSEVKVSVLFPSDVLSQFTTNALHGQYRADEALNILLRGTGLAGSISAEGVVIITQPQERESAMKKKSLLGWMGGLFGVVSTQVVVPVTTYAQTATAQAAPAAESRSADELALEEVVITGSRIQRPGFTSPTPVTSLDASVIEQKAQVNIANVLNEIPAFRPINTETSNAQVNNTIGVNTADLRGLGAGREWWVQRRGSEHLPVDRHPARGCRYGRCLVRLGIRRHGRRGQSADVQAL